MDTTQSVGDHLDRHGRNGVETPSSKSKPALAATTSSSSLVTPGQRVSQPTLSGRASTSDSRLSQSFDAAKNSRRKSRPKHRLQRLDLSLDSNPGPHRGHDRSLATESTEDEDRTSGDEDSVDDEAETGLGHGRSDPGSDRSALSESANYSVNSSATFYVDKAVEELVTTERTYVQDLQHVIQVVVGAVVVIFFS